MKYRMAAANGLLYVWLLAVKGWSLECLLYCLCTSALLIAAVADYRTYEIPVGCNKAILCLGIVRLLTDLQRWPVYTAGFFGVSGFFYLIYVLTKGRGIGGGDIKLMAASGLLLGIGNSVLAMVIGCIAGSVIHLGMMRLGGKERMLAFGPYLALGIVAAMLYGEEWIRWYLGLFTL